eukprot:1299006-Amorphochlora_amoeboformis.AAC.1
MPLNLTEERREEQEKWRRGYNDRKKRGGRTAEGEGEGEGGRRRGGRRRGRERGERDKGRLNKTLRLF